MDVQQSCAIAVCCFARTGAIETLREVEWLLVRPPRSLRRLHELLERWSDPVAIDAGVKALIEAVDPVLDPSGRAARELLAAMRVATRARADAYRRVREARRARLAR